MTERNTTVSHDLSSPTPALTLLRGPLPILAAAVLWGTTGTAATLGASHAPAAAVGSAGLVLGGFLLFLTGRGAWALIAGGDRSTRRTLALGAVAVAGYPLTFYPAVSEAGVAVATVITLGSSPVFSGLLAWWADRRRPDPRWTVATAAAVAGCAVLVLGSEGGGADPVRPLGVLAALAAGFSYSAYALIAERLIRRGHGSSAVMGALFLGGGLLALPVVAALGAGWLATGSGAAVALYLAVFTVFLAYRLFGQGLRHTPAVVATTLTLAEPAVAALLGVLVLHERLAPASWTGLAVLVLGLAVLRAPSPRRP
ncbi:DMT family transporter [Nocardiopsis changdeensis]|uniref:EamA family transporter n=1 Tax=Nocardiopsis changdeensis TaxID=2831969 RepID=A0ABX8BR95_9ACTN|nr:MULTISPECIES: EamA family transporter [Nocardiopsis]QUX24739.1 EamA family transporter [Nocardiopsis changdeensis]QYX35126.1 DMT family transporter [Nocardiopsis sp. MT53]